AFLKHGYEVIGFEDGYYGLIEDKSMRLTYESVSGIVCAGGTILGTSNKADPFNFWHKSSDGQYSSTDESETVRRVYQKHGLDALVCVGGDGSMTISFGLSRLGLNIVGIPKTIDNDLYGTDQSFGFDSAVNVITDAIDRIRTTAMSHHRDMVIETMGRNAGWLALTAGVAGGSDIILIPEIEYDVRAVCREVLARSHKGKRFSLVVVAEGAREKGGQVVVERIIKDSPEPVRLGGVGRKVAEQIEDLTGIESRVTVLGHLQRGGPPSPYDRTLGTLFGKKAMDLVAAGEFGKMVCLRNARIESVDISTPAGKQRRVPLDHPLMEAARSMGAVFGDETA
ncbi:MAG: ATP-dependent 6-phosphofructokinase, partial [Chloroflexota bacterium]|nr:ATP-dependent 6-phosphofructokinase [Chloroflexota bacterium]